MQYIPWVQYKLAKFRKDGIDTVKKQFDVIIIGGGVVGSAVARELSRYQLSICVLERELDVCNGVSGRNTGLLHSGILNDPNTLKMECTLESNAEFDTVAKELDIPFHRCGKLIVGFGEADRAQLKLIYENGVAAGIPGLRMIDKEEIKALEPGANGDCGIFAASAGLLCPFSYTIALAENAVDNGAKYYFNQEVTAIRRTSGGLYQVETEREQFCSRWIINCAGLQAYRISAMMGFKHYEPHFVKGQYELLDKKVGNLIKLPIYPAPNSEGQADVHVTPTIDGNVLVGPTLEKVGAQTANNITQDMLNVLCEQGQNLFPYMKREFFIRNYAGVFPTLVDPDTKKILDFTIETAADIPCAVNVVGINSPGLTCALPIARRVIAKMQETESLEVNYSFNPIRKGIIRFAEQDVETQAELIRKDPDYGEIFCRCECVTKAEIKQAIHNKLNVSTVSGIKYRTRATMGRCQGGYCETRITALIQEELGKKKSEVLLNKKGAYMFTGDVK